MLSFNFQSVIVLISLLSKIGNIQARDIPKNGPFYYTSLMKNADDYVYTDFRIPKDEFVGK
jgi:hypothetical protein